LAHSATRTAPVALIPVSLSPSQSPGADALAARIVKEELIVSIQKELARLGFYRGPDTAIWSRTVRAAARKFVRQSEGRARTPSPSTELLQALRAAKRPVAPEVKADEPKPSLQTAEPPRVPLEMALAAPDKVVIAARSAVPQDGSDNDSYLPPWERGRIARDKSAKPDMPLRAVEAAVQAPKPPARRVLADTSSEGPTHFTHRRHHRSTRSARARRSYAGEPRFVRRTSIFSLGWPWL
jgi:hypothetical protein